MTWSKYAMIALSLVIMIRCIRSMLSAGFEAETWATARFGRNSVPVTHWENLIGRARSADIRIDREDVARAQAVLKRSDDGRWTVYDVFSRGGVSVNGEAVTAGGAEVESGDAVRVGGATMRLQDLGAAKGSALDADVGRAGAPDQIFPVRDRDRIAPEASRGPGLGLKAGREHRTDAADHDHERERDHRVFRPGHAAVQESLRTNALLSIVKNALYYTTPGRP